MSNLFEKFNNLDLDEIRAEANKQPEKPQVKDKQFEDPTPGKYEVRIEKLEIGQSRKGDPMLKCWFKILTGKYENSMLFYNQVLTASQNFSLGARIGAVNRFLQSLQPNVAVEFKDFEQWESMIRDVANDINGRLEYCIDYSQSKSGYPRYKVVEVYDAF